MNFCFYRTFLIGIFLFCCVPLSPVAQTSKSLSVAGRVLERRGKPVTNALVSIYYPWCTGCHDRIIPSVNTNEEGLFAVPVEGKIGSSATIFIEQNVPKGFWSPFFADEVAFSKAGILGIPIRVRSRPGTIQLGDVRPAVEYRTVSIDISKLFHIDPADVTVETLTMTIVRGNAVIYKDITLPAMAVDSSTTVHLALPQGRWGLLFSIQRGTTRIDEQVIV